MCVCVCAWTFVEMHLWQSSASCIGLATAAAALYAAAKLLQHSAASISFISQEQAGCQIGCDSGVLILDKVKCS